MPRSKEFNRIDVFKKSIPVFWRHGFADTTIQSIEKATGVNKSGLYSEFKDKDDLFLSSLEYYIQTNGVADILKREPLGWENVEKLLFVGLEAKGQKGCFVVNSVREASILPKGAKSLIEAHLSRITKFNISSKY